MICCGIILGASNGPIQADPVPGFSELMPLASQSLFLDIEKVGSRLIAVGERGHIICSEDRGSTWRQLRVPTRVMLTSVFFIDDHLGWAVGHDSVILMSTDGGLHWEQVYSDTELGEPLFDIRFFDRQNGMAIGSYGMMLISSDGGHAWQESHLIDEEEDLHLNQLAVDTSGRYFIGAEMGAIYRSDDKGRSWLKLDTPYSGSFYGILPLEPDTLLAFGMLGHLFRSEDAGNTWKRIKTGSKATLTGASRLGDGTIMISGLSGEVLSSSDGGHVFTVAHYPERIDLTSLVPVADDAFVICGDRGCHRFSKDDFQLHQDGEP